MPAIQPVTEKGWGPIFQPEPVLKPKPLLITWNKLPPHFELPDDPVDNFDQPLLAAALLEALEHASLLSDTSLVATNFGLCATVNGETVVKAPDWVYVPDVIPLSEGETRKSYTPYKEGALPEIVMEFLSDDEEREYAKKSTPRYGKWFFYEQILKIPLYAIFNPDNGALEVYQLKSGFYQLQTPDQNGRYWIDALELFLGVWHSPKRHRNRTGYWLRWWDTSGNLLFWGLEKNQQTEKTAKEALEKADAKERAALKKADAEKQVALEQTKIAQQAEKAKQAALEKADAEKQVALEQTKIAQQAEKEKQEALEKAQRAEDEKRIALEKAEKAEREALEKAQRAEDEKRAALEKTEKAEQIAHKAEKATKEALEKAQRAEDEKRAATLQTAKQLLQAKVDMAIIMQVTGLDEASIKNLQK